MGSPAIPTSSLLVSLGFHGELCVLYYRVRVLRWSLPPPGPSDPGITVGIPVFPLSNEGPGTWIDRADDFSLDRKTPIN